ncbi:uncharacterized protein LOC142587871 isoform X2 [Dermacentor variabilis]|uniref:uncharacterized protein LOC142587871 isoform X2 n=1 Tax=Dermacentor variabilis TaxID=34621 RepID=UPI003F5C8C33
MAQSSVSDTIHEAALVITVFGPQKGWVSFLMTSAAQASAKVTFGSRRRIPGAVASVDGTLIVIHQPKGLNPGETQSFKTRKAYYALNTIVRTTGHDRDHTLPTCRWCGASCATLVATTRSHIPFREAHLPHACQPVLPAQAKPASALVLWSSHGTSTARPSTLWPCDICAVLRDTCA